MSSERHKKSKSEKSKRRSLKSSNSSNKSKTFKLKKGRVSKKHSSKKKQKYNSDNEHLTDDSDIEEGGLNLANEIFPLSHYVKDRKKLGEVLFHIVKGGKLTAMLPDILKDTPLEELKQKCFSHLEVMSSKRINHILNGEPMQSSSGTDSEEEGDLNNEAVAKEIAPTTTKKQKCDGDLNNLQTNFVDSTTPSGCEVLSLLAAGSVQENSESQAAINTSTLMYQQQSQEVILEPFTEKCETSSTSSSVEEPVIVGKNSISDSEEEEEEIETIEIVEDEEYANMVDAILEETLVPSDDQENNDKTEISFNDMPTKVVKGESGLSQLELLELQLRARAIKSLMKASQNES